MGNIDLRVNVSTPELWVNVTLKPCDLSQIESRLERGGDVCKLWKIGDKGRIRFERYWNKGYREC